MSNSPKSTNQAKSPDTEEDRLAIKLKKKLSQREESMALEIYAKALELPEAQRKAFIEKQSMDPEIQQYVSLLLSAETHLEDFLEESATTAASPSELAPGQVVANFKIRRTLGQGGLATVYLAHDMSLHRLVALKISKRPVPHEGRLLATLDHPNIVRVYSQSERPEDKPQYLCMQYIPGITLGTCIAHIKNTPGLIFSGENLISLLDERRQGETALFDAGVENRHRMKSLDAIETVLQIGAQLAGALHCAHEHDVLHLDVKPENIILNRYGQPLLMDFNVSMQNHAKADTSVFGGTLAYMSPEQKEIFNTGKNAEILNQVDHRSDIYSLGLVLWEFLECVRQSTPLPEDVESALKRATAPEKNDRYQTAKAFQIALENVLECRKIKATLPKRFIMDSVCPKRPYMSLMLWSGLPILGCVGNFQSDLDIHVKPLLNAFQILALANFGAPVMIVSLALAYVVWGLEILRIRKIANKATDQQSKRKPLRLFLSCLAPTLVHWLPLALYFPHGARSMEVGLTPSIELDLYFAIAQSAIWECGTLYLFALTVILWEVYPKIWIQAKNPREAALKDLKHVPRMATAMFFSFAVTPWLQLLIRGHAIISRNLKEQPAIVNWGIIIGCVATFMILDWLHKFARCVYLYTNKD